MRRIAPYFVMTTLWALVTGCEAPPENAQDVGIDPDVKAALATLEMAEAVDRAIIAQL